MENMFIEKKFTEIGKVVNDYLDTNKKELKTNINQRFLEAEDKIGEMWAFMQESIVQDEVKRKEIQKQLTTLQEEVKQLKNTEVIGKNYELNEEKLEEARKICQINPKKVRREMKKILGGRHGWLKLYSMLQKATGFNVYDYGDGGKELSNEFTGLTYINTVYNRGWLAEAYLIAKELK